MGYSKKHLVIFEEPNSTRNRFITITFDVEPSVNKILTVRLSDEEDLYFLYTVNISEEDFIVIKSQQGLLVDFAGFRQRVVDLLLQCSNEEENAVPKYMLKFIRSYDTERTGILQIVEATNFKYLTHLSLTLLAGNDETLKSYLVDQLKALKVESNRQICTLEKSVAELTFQLANCEKKYDTVLNEFEIFKSDSRSRETRLQTEYESKFHLLDEKHKKTEAGYQDSLAKEQRASMEACESIRSELSLKLEACKRNNQDLIETRDKLQATVRDLTGQLARMETETAASNERLNSTRSQLSSVEQICQNQSATITRLENRVSVLEQDLACKEQLLAKTQDLLTTEREQKAKLQDEMQAQSATMEKLQTLRDKETEEVKKANEIIKHLQTEVKSHHTKAKLRGQVAAEQERLLSAKESELNDRSSEVDRLRAELRKASDTISTLTEQLNQTSTELSDAQKTIKTNENIIGWLNRQISENQIGQVQQRLRSANYTSPTTSLGTMPFRSTSPLSGSNGKFVPNIAPPWHPSSYVNNPSSTIISRLTTVPCCSTTSALTSSVPASGTHLLSPTDGMGTTQLPASISARTPVTCDSSGDRRILLPSHSDSSMKGSMRTTSSLLPVTKSTLLSSGQPVRPSNSARFDLGSGPNSNRLPSYIPSTIASKIRATNSVDVSDRAPGTGTGRFPNTLSPTQEETEQTIQQQSLTSAYFPKPVGASAHV